MTNVRRFAIALPLLALTCLPLPASAAEPTKTYGAEVIGGSVTPFVFDGDLRQLPPAPVWRHGDPIREVPRRATATGLPERTPPAPRLDPLLELQARVPTQQGFTDPIINRAGQSFNGVQPPDPTGDVGTQYFIQGINAGAGTTINVYDKTDGSLVAGPIVLDNLGAAECADGFGDPIVLYDELADRWMLSEFAFQGFFGGVLCVYVSQTSDPVTGGWFNYLFEAQDFPDYPKYGIWPDAYYVSSNEGRPAAYALDRTNMLNGAAARPLQRFTADRLGGFGFESAHGGRSRRSARSGRRAPRATSCATRTTSRTTGRPFRAATLSRSSSIDVDFNNPSNSSFTCPISIQVTDFDSNLCGLNSFECIEQPGSADLDPLREVVMYRAAYRNFGTHETLTGDLRDRRQRQRPRRRALVRAAPHRRRLEPLPGGHLGAEQPEPLDVERRDGRGRQLRRRLQRGEPRPGSEPGLHRPLGERSARHTAAGRGPHHPRRRSEHLEPLR